MENGIEQIKFMVEDRFYYLTVKSGNKDVHLTLLDREGELVAELLFAKSTNRAQDMTVYEYTRMMENLYIHG